MLPRVIPALIELDKVFPHWYWFNGAVCPLSVCMGSRDGVLLGWRKQTHEEEQHTRSTLYRFDRKRTRFIGSNNGKV